MPVSPFQLLYIRRDVEVHNPVGSNCKRVHRVHKETDPLCRSLQICCVTRLTFTLHSSWAGGIFRKPK